MTCHAHHTDSSGPHTKHCVHRVATFMATCSNIGVVSVIVVIVLIEHCKDPSFTRWPHFSPSWTFRDHPSRLLTVTHSIMCTLPRCAISHSFDGLPARLDVLGSRPDHRRARAFELSPRSSQLPWRSSPRFLAMYSPAEMLHKGSEKTVLERIANGPADGGRAFRPPRSRPPQRSNISRCYGRVPRSRPPMALASRETAVPRPQCRW